MELITALFEVSAVLDDSGHQIPFHKLAKYFTEMLNTDFSKSQIYNERDAILNLKRKPAEFLEQLAYVLNKKV